MTIKEFKLDEHLEKIAEPVKGMDEQYEKLIRQFHNIFLDESRTEQHKREQRAKISNEITDLKRESVNNSLEVIEQIREDYSVKAPAEPGEEATERLLQVTLWKEFLPSAAVDELRRLYEGLSGNSDFMTLLHSEIRKRNDTESIRLKHEIENPPAPKGMEALDRLEKWLGAIKQVREYWHTSLAEKIENGDYNIDRGEQRSVDADFNKLPGDDIEGYRPKFKIKAE